MDAPATPPSPGPAPNRRIVTAAILSGIFLVAMDILVVSPALPVIVAELQNLSYYPWVAAIYILASTTTVPLYGKLADMYGRKPIYLLGMGLFLLGSIGSGLAPSMVTLVAARAVQGLGGGAIMPVTLVIVGDLYPLKERARMQGIFSGVWGVASIVGPMLGGWLVDEVGWRWIFFINLPFGVAAAALIARYLREDEHRRSPHAVPYLGAALLGGAILGFLLALLLPGMGVPWLSPKVVGLLAASLVLLVAFARVDRFAAEPIVDGSLLRMRMFVSCNLAGFFISACLYGAASYVPLFVRGVQAESAKLAGFALTPMSLGWVLAAIVTGRLILRVGYRVMSITGLLFILVGTFLLGTLREDTSFAALSMAMATVGLGLGASMTSFLIAIQNSVGREKLGVATSSMQLFRMTGSVVGIAALGAILLTTLPPEMREAEAGVPLLSHLMDESSGLADPLRGPLARSLRLAFLGGFAFAVAGLLAGLFVPGGRAERHLHAERRESPGEEGPPE